MESNFGKFLEWVSLLENNSEIGLYDLTLPWPRNQPCAIRLVDESRVRTLIRQSLHGIFLSAKTLDKIKRRQNNM